MRTTKIAAPREAAQNKTYQTQDNTERKIEQARVCASCGRPLGLMAYETPSGDLLHPDDRCLAGYIGATLSVPDSILFSGREVPCSAQTSNS